MEEAAKVVLTADNHCGILSCLQDKVAYCAVSDMSCRHYDNLAIATHRAL